MPVTLTSARFGTVVQRDVTVDPDTLMVQWPGQTPVHADHVLDVAEKIAFLYNQNVNDGDFESQSKVLRDDGTTVMTVGCAVAGTKPNIAITSISPGSVAYDPDDALELIDAFVALELIEALTE